MSLRIFSIVGESLNFGARRMETIMRVAWLPVVLLLLVDLTAVFAYLSIIVGKLITLAEIPSFAQAKFLLQENVQKGWTENPQAMWAVTIGFWTLQAILISSFVAPLIRLSGLGERPAPGVVRLPFGAAQVRLIGAGIVSAFSTVVFLWAPVAASSVYVGKIIDEALTQTYVKFPNADSLHQMEIIPAKDVLAERGEIWLYNLGIPWAAAVPFSILLWALIYTQFRHKNAPAISFGRAAWTAIVSFLSIAGVFLLMRGSASSAMKLANGDLYAPLAVAVAIMIFLGLKLFAYPGVVVSRGSMALGPALRATHGWNILRMFAILTVLLGILYGALYAINMFLQIAFAPALNGVYFAVESIMTLAQDGAKPNWVRPVFVWIWTSALVLINIFWTFFSYGSLAGLWGRLYRESERVHEGQTSLEAEPAIWRHGEE